MLSALLALLIALTGAISGGGPPSRLAGIGGGGPSAAVRASRGGPAATTNRHAPADSSGASSDGTSGGGPN